MFCPRINIRAYFGAKWKLFLYIHDFSVGSDNALIQIDREWIVDGGNTSCLVNTVRH